MLLRQNRSRTAKASKYIFRRHLVEIQGIFINLQKGVDKLTNMWLNNKNKEVNR